MERLAAKCAESRASKFRRSVLLYAKYIKPVVREGRRQQQYQRSK